MDDGSPRISYAEVRVYVTEGAFFGVTVVAMGNSKVPVGNGSARVLDNLEPV